jgi:hypothetical protein
MVDEQTLKASSKRVGKILVEVDIHLGLLETLEIEWRSQAMSQHLDYLGIPFRCSFCRKMGHLWRDCKGFVEEEESEDSMLWKATREHSPEVDSFEIGAHHSAQEETSLVEPTNTFSGKLKTIFPLFFLR